MEDETQDKVENKLVEEKPVDEMLVDKAIGNTETSPKQKQQMQQDPEEKQKNSFSSETNIGNANEVGCRHFSQGWYNQISLEDFAKQVPNLPPDFNLANMLDDKEFSVDNLVLKQKFSKFAQSPFLASQWLKFFRAYTHPDFIASNRRDVFSKLHHALRQMIIQQTFTVCQRNYVYLAKDFKTVVAIDHVFIHQQLKLTQYYPECPALNLDTYNDRSYVTMISVFEGDCLEVALHFQNQGYTVIVLNMANAYHAGGGYRAGDGAQEENLHRRTNLYQSLEDPEGIQEGKNLFYPIAETGAIYSPNILVMRESELKGYGFLMKPRLVSFISAAAPARPPLYFDKTTSSYMMTHDVAELFRMKIRTLFAVALKHGHDALILSSWGCGAFKCPPVHVAKLFQEVSAEFKGKFKLIVFAIIDDHNARRDHNPEGNVLPFAKVFNCQPQRLVDPE